MESNTKVALETIEQNIKLSIENASLKMEVSTLKLMLDNLKKQREREMEQKLNELYAEEYAYKARERARDVSSHYVLDN